MRTGTYTVPTPRLTKIDVLSRVAYPASTGNLRPAIAPTAGHDHLAAVRVARQHELHVERRRLDQAPRIVREQQRRAAGALQHPGDFARRARPEADAGQIEPLAPDRQRGRADPSAP